MFFGQHFKRSVNIQGASDSRTRMICIGFKIFLISQYYQLCIPCIVFADFIYPARVDDSIHPSVHPGAFAKLLQAFQGPFTGSLNEIIRPIWIPGQAPGEPPQTGK
jgi:hypothetical protein